MKKTIFTLALTLGATGGAMAADWGFDDWDRDGDRLVNEHEFVSGVSEQDVFGVENVGDDDLMSPEEWDDIQLRSDVNFDDWYTAGPDATPEDVSVQLFAYLDDDDDGRVTEDEWARIEDLGR